VTNPKAPVEIPGSYLSYDARIFGSGGFLETSKGDGLLQIDLPERLLNPVDTIVVLTPKILSPDRSAIRRDPR